MGIMKKTYTFKTSRVGGGSAAEKVPGAFDALLAHRRVIDVRTIGIRGRRKILWTGAGPSRPILRAALANACVYAFLEPVLRQAVANVLIREDGASIDVWIDAPDLRRCDVPAEVAEFMKELSRRSSEWGGELTSDGEYEFDPRTPSPGTHFRVNLLLGDRVGCSDPLLTTPKAVVDAWGGGSSRSHADKQILATRWDVLPCENGFPANRQFYLVKDGRQIFYSADSGGRFDVRTCHSSNFTTIRYSLPDGLYIERVFFVVPAEENLPLGMEAQLIRFRNDSGRSRSFDAVLTGMFGFPHPGALTVDVIYTCVTVEPGVVIDEDSARPVVVAPRYTAGWGRDDRPFNVTQVVYPDGRRSFSDAVCLDYEHFVGAGTLQRPENIAALDNVLPRRGPAFFAQSIPVVLEPGQTVECQSFNGLVSSREGELVTDEVFTHRMGHLARKLEDPRWASRLFAEVRSRQRTYASALQVDTPDKDVDQLVNTHLPFQVRYQSYVSRSFGLTQKGFRQIGFREIQDLFAGMPFEVAAGRSSHVKDLIGVWAGHVHRFGYADHQFYWEGAEPGRYSDDALWLFQAVGRYIDLTGDKDILFQEERVAATTQTRTIYETLRAILHYSGKVSVGRNGLPLIDRADWNDTLNLDGEGMHGPEKEALYAQQIAEGAIADGDPIRTDLSESVMNGFLLEIARSYMARFARMVCDRGTEKEWTKFGSVLRDRRQAAWKGDFFARAFINRPNPANATYLGGAGDGLSAEPSIPGTYFLNSFSWSVLSGVATEEQIATMLDRIEDHLVTPVGIRLSSPTRFDLLMGRNGSGDYAYGDRENGGVFKHAAMMGVVALLEAAKRVANRDLAEQLMGLALRVLRVTAPFSVIEDPYTLGGNPRFCTQYTNPATGENIGPLLSGTAPWMWLAYLNLLGVRFREGRVVLDPLLPPEWAGAKVSVRMPHGVYRIKVVKPKGTVRCCDEEPLVTLEGVPCGRELPVVAEGEGKVRVEFAGTSLDDASRAFDRRAIRV